jgi:hypothetical protein
MATSIRAHLLIPAPHEIPDAAPRGRLALVPPREPPKCPSDRVLAYLLRAEGREGDPSLCQDVRQAWIVVFLAARDEPQPFLTSSYICYGTHPDLLFAKLTATRQSKLGKEYDRWFDAAGNLKRAWLEIPDYDPTSGLRPHPSGFRERGSSIPAAVGALTWTRDGRSSPKGPLRLVVRRSEVRTGEHARYHEEQLECGHSHIEFLGANPGNRRRRCRKCAASISAKEI